MRHSYHLDGHAFGLRPVELADAEFIVQLRARDPQRVRYLHPVAPDVQLQRNWIERYFEREHDYYWVVEQLEPRLPEGLLGIYDLKPADKTAEWGRWVLRPASLAAVESALLVYRAAFDLLGLEALFCFTVADNLPVISFHDSSGLSRQGLLKAHFKLGDGIYDAVKHVCTRESWPNVRNRLEPQARLIGERFRRTR
jgi:RimJ/RimL family protein N-acetyltransferase